jgi:hypothetical protein
MTQLNNFIRRYTTIPAVIDMLRQKELTILDPQSWDDRNDRYFMRLYKEKKNVNALYGLCAAQCSETYHHWRVFTNSADGACVEIHRSRLEVALSRMANVRFGPMEYLRLNEITHLTQKDAHRLPFLKRIGFADESEYRIVVQADETQGSAYKIGFNLNWINRIYLNPWLPKSIAESVIATLKSIPGCGGLAISRSQLIDSSRWKKAGDDIVGRPTSITKVDLPRPLAPKRTRAKRAPAKPQPRKGRKTPKTVRRGGGYPGAAAR